MIFNVRIVLSLILFGCLSLISVNYSVAQNLVLGKKYTFSVQPNYRLTEGTDGTDLTDGKKKYGALFWQDKSTVGWNGIRKLEITFDLRATKPIGEIKINTARNINAGVQYPKGVYVFCSNDNKNYFYLGDIMASIYNSAGEYEVKSFSLGKLNEKYRFIKLIFIPNGNNIFIDEVEVFSTQIKSKKRGREVPLVPIKKIDEKVALLVSNTNKNFEILADVSKQLLTLRELGYSKLLLDKELDNLNLEDFKEVSDFKEHLRYKVIDKLSVDFPQEAFLLRPVNTWGQWGKIDTTRFTKTMISNFNFIGLKDASHYGAFQIINPKKVSQIFLLNNDCKDCLIQFYEVPNTPTLEFIGVYDALVPLKKKELSIGPGEAKYIWFSVIANNDDSSRITVSVNNNVKEIPFSVETLKFPNSDISLNTNVWAYLDYPIIDQNRNAVVSDLLGHGINSIVVNGKYVPLIGDYDFSRMKDYLKQFGHLDNYKVLLNVNFEHLSKKTTIDGSLFLSKSWQITFKKWYTKLLTEMSIIGVKAENVFMYPYDEISDGNLEDFINLSLWSRESFKELQLYVTVNEKKALKVIPFANISQVSLFLSKEAITQYPKSEIWYYDVIDNSRGRSPYSNYRLMAWKAFIDGYKGIGFWNYLALGANESNNYQLLKEDLIKDYSVVYTDGQMKIISSRRWEGFSKGLEDYKVLQSYSLKKGREKALVLAKRVFSNKSDIQLADSIIRKMLTEMM